MFKGKKQEIVDIDYYKKEEDKEDDSDDECLIFLSKGKKKNTKDSIKQKA